MDATPAQPSFQSTLNESTFATYLEGYAPIVPQDLLDARGGRVRYAIDTPDAAGNVVETKYRLGGILTFTDPRLRFCRVFNPSAPNRYGNHPGMGWSVQLRKPRGERIRLWYMPPGSKDEIAMFRKLLQRLESGEIKIARIN